MTMCIKRFYTYTHNTCGHFVGYLNIPKLCQQNNKDELKNCSLK